MAAFDLKATPKSLGLKPGSSGTFVLVVSNRLGRPVTGELLVTVTPVAAAKWLVPPKELQKRFEPDPAATLSFDYTVNVPADAVPQTVQVSGFVRDVAAPDDNKSEVEVVTVDVSPNPPPPPNGKKLKIPWWVWVVAGVVLVGAAIGIYFATRSKGVPNVKGMTVEEATEKLKKAGFKKVTAQDTMGVEDKANVVVLQKPEAGAKLPEQEEKKDKKKDKEEGEEGAAGAAGAAADTLPDSLTTANIWVNRRERKVPPVINTNYNLAINQVKDSGLVVTQVFNVSTRNAPSDDLVQNIQPAPGTPRPEGSAVSLYVWKYDPNMPEPCRFRLCTEYDPNRSRVLERSGIRIQDDS